MLRLDVLPAGHGDCLMITWGAGGTRRRMLIDAGTAESYDDGLRRYLAERPRLRRLDIFVVTHVDTDHIDGAIKLLRDTRHANGFPDLTVGDIWFNTFDQLADPGNVGDGDGRGGLQGEYFTHLIGTLPLNKAFGGRSIRRDYERFVRLGGGARALVVTPGQRELTRLRKEWSDTCRRAGFTAGVDTADIAGALAKRRNYDVESAERGDTRSGTGEAAKRPGSDTSAANGSSIGLLVEHGNRRILLAGDAHARGLHDAFAELNARWGTQRIRLDVFKLPHHGSVANLTPALLDQIDCRHFVISTNGDRFGHPDIETLQLLADYHSERGWRSPITVSFNYASRIPTDWHNPALRFRAAPAGAGVSLTLR